ADGGERRAGAAAAGPAVGPDRQGISIRDRRGDRLAGRPLPRALAAPHLPLHVRARLHGGVSVLLGDRRRVRRLRRPPGQPRRHAFGGVAGSARETAGIQAADGLELPLGVLARRGLDGLCGTYQWLDRAPKGRNETGVWWRRHDEYNKG